MSIAVSAPTQPPIQASIHVAVPVRTGALALWASSVLLTATVIPHPSILDGDVGGVVHDTGVWSALHLSAALGIVLGWWGATCTLALHRDRLGTWAAPLFAVTTLGAFALSAVMLIEAVTFPYLATHAPGSLELDGPIFTSLSLRAVSVLGGGFLAGFGLLGLALVRTRTWPEVGWALMVAMTALAVLAGPFVPVLGPLSSVAVAGAISWLGLRLWQAAPGASAGPR